jgi:hypothetical protein
MAARNHNPNPEPKLPDPERPDQARVMRLLIVSAVIVGMPAIVTPLHAQNYPWCSNFADGAGTNCGFSTLEQCKATIAGSGGYCDQNTLYKTPVAAAPAPAQHLKRNHHARKNS